MTKLTELKTNAVRQTKRLVNSQRGISPIFATLIILAVVTVLFVPIFIWATGTTSQTEDSWESSGITVTERLVIEEVNPKPNNFTIYVRNIGKTALTIDNVFITCPDGNLNVFTLGDFDVIPEDVLQGELLIATNLDVNYVPGTYVIKVFTPRGVSDTFQVVVE